MTDLASVRKSFQGDILTQGDPGYEEAIARWSVIAVRRARIVAFVKNAEDVARALKYAKANNIRIAVRGGGHSPNGASSSEDGLIIDLSRYLTSVRVDPDKKLAYAQGGAVWETVDKAGIEHGLATVGGTVNHTGIGGLSTGGGYGWLSGRHGLVIDNIVQATVVVANGDILIANKTENPDLFYGIRGGGSNFGVVTEFVYRMHPQRHTVHAGPIIFQRDQLPQIAKALEKWFATASADEAINAVLTLGPDKKPAVLLFVFYNGSDAEGREKYKIFSDLGPVMDARQEMPFENLNAMFNDGAQHGQCCWMRGVLSKDPMKILNFDTLDRVVEYCDEGRFRASMIVEFVPHDKINSVPPQETPYRRDLPGNTLSLVFWDENTPENLVMGMKIVTELADIAKDTEMAYGNYSPDTDALPVAEGPKSPNRAKELFRDNYPKLQKIKRKYDPDMVFNKWFVIEPAAA